MSAEVEADLPPNPSEDPSAATLLTSKDQAFVPEIPSEEPLDDESTTGTKDEAQDTPSRTSTRLVKFQLFETKAVSLSLAVLI